MPSQTHCKEKDVCLVADVAISLYSSVCVCVCVCVCVLHGVCVWPGVQLCSQMNIQHTSLLAEGERHREKRIRLVVCVCVCVWGWEELSLVTCMCVCSC